MANYSKLAEVSVSVPFGGGGGEIAGGTPVNPLPEGVWYDPTTYIIGVGILIPPNILIEGPPITIEDWWDTTAYTLLNNITLNGNEIIYGI